MSPLNDLLTRAAGHARNRFERRLARRVTGHAPVAVGGVGGSGTRLVARILADLGYAIGGDLNESNDNLTFTLLFKTPLAVDADDRTFDDLWTVFRAAMTGAGPPPALHTVADWRDAVRGLAVESRPLHPSDWLRERLTRLETALAAPAAARPRLWAWKEPNTHLVVERLLAREPSLRYVHVVRHGLDVAFSANQNQLEMWGARVLGRPVARTPRDSLAYWVATHRRVEALAERAPGRVLLLNYDALCREPKPHLERMLAFLNVRPRLPCRYTAAARVAPPATLGRHHGHDLTQFDADDLAYIRHLGFATAR